MKKEALSLHLIQKRASPKGLLAKVKGETNLWDSACWRISDLTAESLRGRKVYLHEKKNAPCYFGGTVKDIFSDGNGKKIIRFAQEKNVVGFETTETGWKRELKIVWVVKPKRPLISQSHIEPIIVHWSESEETLLLDFHNPQSWSLIKKSTELWLNYENLSTTYRISTEVRQTEALGFEVLIEYNLDNNPKLKDEDIPWGTSKLNISLNPKKGQARWKPQGANKFGRPYDIQFEGVFFVGKRRTVLKSAAFRKQEMFREALIKDEPCCALTGETTTRALEAAHIVSVAKGGSDQKENGILLRADLHRLFDMGLFTLTKAGTVKKVGTVSEDYKKLLRGATLTPRALDRVKVALKHYSAKG
jgi:HNH endonuclease